LLSRRVEDEDRRERVVAEGDRVRAKRAKQGHKGRCSKTNCVTRMEFNRTAGFQLEAGLRHESGVVPQLRAR
jgi:hypothetical protein